MALAISKELKFEIENSDFYKPHSQEYLLLQERGYFNEYNEVFEGKICDYDIDYAIANIPQIVFEVTSACNLNCEYCCYGECYETFKRRDSGVLNFKTAKIAIDYILSKIQTANNASTNTPFVISFYGGEPLLNFQAIKNIVNYAKSLNLKNRQLRFSMTTNGTLLGKYADFLAENNFSVLVSLDGDRENNKYRITKAGKESYDIIMENLNWVKKRHPQFFSSIRFNSVFTNRSSIDSLLHFFKNSFDKYPTISQLHEADKDADGYDKLQRMIKSFNIPDEYKYDEDFFLEIPIHKKIADICFKLFRNSFVSESEIIPENPDLKYLSGTCIPFSKRMFVSHDGRILPCEKISRDFPLAKIDTLNECLEICVDDIVENFNTLISNISKQCKTCYRQMNCTQCGHNFKKGKCTQYTNKDKFISFMKEAFDYIEKNPQLIPLIEKNLILR